jgi:ATP-dependent Clp protease ATP-binding subunit ClpX
MRCSFCGKHQDAVEQLVAGGARPGTFICNECLELCRQIIADESPAEPIPPRSSGWMERLRRMTVALPR